MKNKKRAFTNVSILLIFCLVFMSFPKNSEAFGGVSARNAVLMEQSTGRVLYAKLPDSPQLIASITKIMTATLAIESGKMDDVVTVSQTAIQTEGSSIYLKVGQKITLRDLVYGLMLRSGNDAANVIAEHVGGSIDGFVYMMNEKAAEIGMMHTVFANPSGLESKGKEHYSSAYDMALLTRYAMQNDEYRKVASTKQYRTENTAESWDYIWKNKNKLLTMLYPYSTGGKTGFTKKAGRTLVSTASKDGLDLIVVTLSAGDDWNDHMNLFNYAFKEYQLVEVLTKGIVEGEKFNKKGYIYVKNSFYYPIKKDEAKSVRVEYTYDESEMANHKVGKAIFYLGNEKIGERNLFYTNSKMRIKAKFFLTEVGASFRQMIGMEWNG